MLYVDKTISPDDWAILRTASKLLAYEIMLEEIKNSLTWGPIPQVTDSIYIVNKLDCTPCIWACFLEMTEWGAALLCPGDNEKDIMLDKEIVDIFIRSIRHLLEALASSTELVVTSFQNVHNNHRLQKKRWNQLITDDLSPR